MRPEGKGAEMRKVFFGLLIVLIAGGLFANVHTDRAISSMTYVTDPVNGMYHPDEGLLWIFGDPTNAAAPAIDNRSPSYLGAYFWSTAAVLMGMNATNVSLPYGLNGIERVFVANFDYGDSIQIAGGTEPWWSEHTTLLDWNVDSLLMCDASIPWRLDPGMRFATTSDSVYLERVLWTTYMLTLCENIEYSPYIAQILRGIRNNPTYYDTLSGAIMYDGVDNTYLTALWGLVLESYMRSFENYPVRARVDGPPEPDYDWTEESDAAMQFINLMMGYYFGTQLPGWWTDYNGGEGDRAHPMLNDPVRGLERWEYLPIIMFYAVAGSTDTATGLWNNHMEDVLWWIWETDVEAYFRNGPIWNGFRGYYDPLHRPTGIYPFYEFCQMEMYRATQDSQYINRILQVETGHWDPLWDGNFWVQGTPLNNTPIWNGMHSWVLAHMPNIEIVGVTSDLPSEGPVPYDYSANVAQDHVITVKVANLGLVPVDSLLMTVNEVYAGGSRTGQTYVPYAAPGETVDVLYDIGGPGLAGDDSIFVTFQAVPWIAGYTVVDSDLVVLVQDPAELDMIYTGGDTAVSAPRSPYITHNSSFNVEIQIENTGGAAIREIDLDIYQSSPYGLAFTFPAGTNFSGQVDIPGGTIGYIQFPAIAPDGVGDTLLDDIYVWAVLNSATDENERAVLAPGEITITDDEENFDIQLDPEISWWGIWTSTGWVNATDPETVEVYIENAVGDYAAADSFDKYPQYLELIASTVTGICGLDAPTATPDSVPDGSGGENVQFVLTNCGASENAAVGIRYVGHYHDANRGDAAEGLYSPVDDTAFGWFGIDIIAPEAQPIAPVPATDWPPDDTLLVGATDNLSGVAAVQVFLMDSVQSVLWNWTAGTWTGGVGDTIDLLYDGALDRWWDYRTIHPAAGEHYVMFIIVTDTAGNVSHPFYVPLGTIDYAHIVEVGADLWRGSPLAPVPPLSDYEYECDTGWTYVCSVRVQNTNTFALANVELELYSISPQTQIVDLTGPTGIPAGGTIRYYFQVTEPGYSFKDSLYAHIIGGTHAVNLTPIGEMITDNDFRVLVERPVNFELVDVWVEPDSINVWLGDGAGGVEDTACVSMWQTFTYHATVRNNGEDVIDSVAVTEGQDNSPPMLSYIGPPNGPFTYYDKSEGWTETLTFSVMADTLTSGPNPEQWDQNLLLLIDSLGFTANNHPPGYVTELIILTDTLAPIAVQEPSRLDDCLCLSDGDSNFFWINMTNTVDVTLGLWNMWGTEAGGPPDDDRAAADRLGEPGYTTKLLFYDPTWTTQAYGLVDRFAPTDISDVLVEPGVDTTLITWNISWDGSAPTYEGVLDFLYEIDFGDENWQSEDFSRYSCATIIMGTQFLGLDVSRPTCDIIWPLDGGYYVNYPETIRVLCTDSVSGVVNDSVRVQFENMFGEVWDGTIWRSGSWWFPAHYDITYGPDTFWYEIPTPDSQGCYTYYAYAWDTAGNQSLIDEVSFIYDNLPPHSSILAPTDDYYTYTGCNTWDQCIGVWAEDDTSRADYDCVSHVSNVYVAIRDTIRSYQAGPGSEVWWNGSGWTTSGSAQWLSCTPASYPDYWEYCGYDDSTTAVLEIYCYARDSAGNLFAPNDTLQFVRIDEVKPNSVLLDSSGAEMVDVLFANPVIWADVMGNELWGYCTDSITRVDSVRYSIWDSLSDLYWDGTDFTSASELWLEPDQYNYNGSGWFTPDTPPHAPGVAIDYDDTLWWRAAWIPPDYGFYRIRSKGYDDLCHEETVFDTQNVKRVIYDNCPPVVHARYPLPGGVYFLTGDWQDSICVFAYDSCGFPVNDVDSVKFWISYSAGGTVYWWGFHPIFMMWGWWGMMLSVDASYIPASYGLWQYRYPGLIGTPGTYNLVARAYDIAGNVVTRGWSWTITTTGAYLTIENFQTTPNDDPYFVDDNWFCRVVAWNSPSSVDTNFSEELFFGSTMPNPADFEVLTPGSYYCSRGTLIVECVAHAPILGLEVNVSSASMPTASTEPIDIIANIDDNINGYIADNPNDQGNWLWLVHNRTPQDVLYCGPFDTTSIKIVDYYYFRDMDLGAGAGDTNWQPIVVTMDSSFCDSVRLRFGNFNTFQQYDYSMFVELIVQGLGTPLFTDRIPLGSGVPVDNIAPASITDLTADYVGGNIFLDWSEITQGIDASAEIDPATNIVYDIYRFNEPYGSIGAPWVTGCTDHQYTDVTGAGDVTTPYFYAVKGRDHDNNETPDESNRVGEVDYALDDGWVAVAYPLPVTGVDSANHYATHLGAPFQHMYAYSNPPGGWDLLMLAGIPWAEIEPGLEDMMGYVVGLGGPDTFAWTGSVPADSEAIVYALSMTAGDGWNGVMLPLHHHSGLVLASDLYLELDALGLSPITVAYRIPGGGWQQIVEVGGTFYMDFPIYRGQAYLVWVDNSGVWPNYPPRKRGVTRRTINAHIGAKVQDIIGMPVCAAIPVFAEDKTEFEEVTATATWGENVIDCAYDNGMVTVQLSDFEDIEPGTVVEVTISANGGAYVANITVTVPDAPVEVTEPVVLAKARPELPTEFALHGNVPNPFNPTTTIRFDLPEEADCELAIYNINGRKIRTLVDSKLEAGYCRAIWDGTDDIGRPVSAGIYFYKLNAGKFSAQRRMLLVK